MPIKTATFAERPDLHRAIWSDEFRQNWAAFVDGGVIADLYYDSFFLPKDKVPFLEYGLVAWDSDNPNKPLARAFCVPFVFGGHRRELPDTGWDGVVRWADWDYKSGATPNAVSAIEINVLASEQGRGLSGLMLAAMRQNAKRLGFADLYAPVRPNFKHLEPHTPMLEYAHRTREDGLPVDPWLRVHARAGASIVKIAPNSMTMSGTLEQWRGWTGLPFDQSGEVVVPGALVPVLVSVQHNVAAYVEPNVWMHHKLEG
jgi:GNAT superfamily N-acetyltransferase